MPPDTNGTSDREHSLVAFRSSTGALLITATVLASLVGFLDAYVAIVAGPAIKRDLGGSATALQFVVTGYLLTVASFLLLSGALADRFGRRRVLEVGLLVMLLASVLCSLAPSVWWLIAARIALGVGGALVVPSSLAMLNGTLRVVDGARGIGIWAGLATLGTTVGQYASGWLVDHASWRWVFLFNVPVIAVVAGILAVAVGFFLLSGARPGESCVQAIFPGALFWGLGAGLLVTPLTAAVLAAVSDADPGEASAINDGASRVWALLITALVPVLIGGSGAEGLTTAIQGGYSAAMIVMGGITVASAIVPALFVSNVRPGAMPMTPVPGISTCALPVADRPVPQGGK